MPKSNTTSLKAESRAQLDLPLGIIRSKPQRLVRQQMGVSMDLKRRSKRCPYKVIHVGVIGPVGEIKRLRHDLDAAPFAQLEAPAYAQVHVEIIWADSGVAAHARRTVGKVRVVAIHVSSGEQSERTRAVVLQDRSQFETTQAVGLNGTVNDSSHHHFVPLIERRETALGAWLELIVGPIA